MREPRLDLVLLWHMHQPDYRDPATGRFMLPWTYLHAIKDYSDMAAHIERHPKIRAVFNFVPVLLDQIDDYVRQFDEGRIRDPLLGLLQVADLDRIDPAERSLILERAFASNHSTMLEPYAEYRRLLELHRLAAGGAREGERREPRFSYLSGAYLGDLLVWYHLVWVGESERRANPLFGRLMARGAGFTHSERLQLFEAIGAILRTLLPRYRALAERGRIELSTTPSTHPIAPLMIDLRSAHESLPLASLPEHAAYPGGAERVRWQIGTALASHAQRFGSIPAGLWPAEGAVSAEFLAELDHAGLRWAASSETVLANSLGARIDRAGADRSWLHRSWRHPSSPGLTLMFRDERLSDRIGFEYSKWHGRDAAVDLIGELEAIGRAAPAGETRCVLIALDGENAWEYYPYNGYYFFDEFYSRLEAHPWITTRTLREAIDDATHPPESLPGLVAGSWVSGTLSTWIGDRDKNRAWDLLCEAKATYDRVLAETVVAADRRAALERQLAVCEASDWFWWLGPGNPAPAVARFEQLFRHNLRGLYRMLGVAAPPSLDQALGASAGASRSGDSSPVHPESGGAMRRSRDAA